MITLIVAAAVVAQPAPPADMPMAGMQHGQQEAKKDCCKDCCKDMAKHEGHDAEHRPAQ